MELSSFMMNKKYQIIYLARFAMTVFLLNYQIPQNMYSKPQMWLKDMSVTTYISFSSSEECTN